MLVTTRAKPDGIALRSAPGTRISSLFVAFGLGASALGVAVPASAAEPSPVRWHDEWPRFRPVEYASTGVLAAGTLVLVAAAHEPDHGWSGGIVFDDGARSALRAGSRDGRERAAGASDVLVLSSLALPVLGDVVISAWAAHGSGDAAFQMALIEAESFALTLALVSSTKLLAARERPLERECRANPDYSPACREKLDGSFYSGHSNLAFTAAGLVCTNHLNLPLWGSRAADIGACAGALGLAATTGVLRIVADRHYASDVLVGTGAGLLGGMLVPWLLHYQGGEPKKVAVLPALAPGYSGVMVTGALD